MSKSPTDYYGRKTPTSSVEDSAPQSIETPATKPDKTSAPLPKKQKTRRQNTTEVEPRSVLRRLFGISLWGAVKLVLWCILIGFVVIAANFDPRSPDVDVPAALASVAQQAAQAASWAARNFWKPALAGATIVLPIWVIWRLVSLPFRK